MAKSNKLIISAALTGAGTTKQAAPSVPITANEIAEDVVRVVKAGAAIVHIHVRDDNGYGTMDTQKFIEAFEATKEACIKADIDPIINLTTSGGPANTELRLAHLRALKPEMCSYDAGTMNWANSFIFENSPEFLEKLGTLTQELDIKPEIELFDASMIGNAMYYINKGFIKTPSHFQFVLGVPGGLDGTIDSVNFMLPKLPPNSTWSITGIGKTHMPMMLAGLAAGADGIRVGLEDNVYMSKGVVATNISLVLRAVELAELCGREIATPAEAREILGITRKSW
jgi:uncharacterized protein (DUF849 family)